MWTREPERREKKKKKKKNKPKDQTLWENNINPLENLKVSYKS